jgi:ferredoxin-NADP reductase
VTTDASSGKPSRWQEAVIERVVHQTPRVSSVFLRSALGPYQAGQHADVRLTAPDGYQAERSYSIASAPGADRIELAIERLEGGEVSPYFDEAAIPGDTIEIRGPIGGHFVWRGTDGGPLLLIGGGSGVVPLMAMIRYRAMAALDMMALLIYSSRTWEELIFRDELVTVRAREPNFELVVTTTREPRHRPQDFDRRLDRSLLREILTRWGQAPRHVYVCGSNAFVEAATSALVLEAVPPQIIRAERYGGTA